MVAKRDVEAGSWETLSLEDRVEKLKNLFLTKFSQDDLDAIPDPPAPGEASISTKRGRR
jgi:hypothetical protein